jgi:16S rRNA (uracil1498-N3)-methyltransferase
LSPPRLYLERPLGPGAAVPIDRAQEHYLLTVLRLAPGDPVLAFNGRDGEWRAELVAGRVPALRLVERKRAPADEPGPTLLVAPLKAPRLAWLAEKAVELGVARIVPVLTERAVARPESSRRLRRRMVEAAEQCGRLTLPELADPVRLLPAVDAVGAGGLVAYGDPAGTAPPLLGLLETMPVHGVLIGPEGGLTPRERRALQDRPWVRPVSLGPRVLRAETAALHALACWSAVADQLAAAAASARSSGASRPASTGGDSR